ncbi:fimbrial protein [Bacteroides graminisolvens]|uniref:fimbrial protein n=1 Tax=Bacteroides graminisolvens TaxID=477666 RepID=UPI0023F53EBA|nr:fimbrial protein [Bacteroides graminisolvens]MDD3211359.1 fimbrial protein [Bacteroides graminisolvens]
MKKNFYLMTALCAIMLSACSADTDPAPTTEKDRTAILEINLVGTTTRATGTLPGDTGAENQLNTVAVGVFNSDNSTNTIAEFKTEDVEDKTAAVNCLPATGCTVIAVANAPSGTFAGVANKAAFIAKTVALSQTNSADVQTNTNLPMSAQQTGVDLTVAGPNTATLALSRLVSRISIADIKTAFDPSGQYKDATFTATGIFLYDAKSTSTVDPATPVTTNLISGETAGNEYLMNTLSDVLIPAGGHATPYWFYTFANDATNPTKLVIKGNFDADGSSGSTYSPEPVYYPVVINKSQTGTVITGGSGDATIARNRAYKIGVTIKGKGVSSPSENIVPAVLTVTVSVLDWALVINQSVVFD